MAVLGDSGGVRAERLFLFALARPSGTLPGDSPSGARTVAFLHQENQIKRIEGRSLEGCGRGKVFRPFAFRRGGGGAQWPESMSLWRILPTVEHPPLLSPSSFLGQISTGHQVSKAWAAGESPSLPHTRICSLTAICFSLKFLIFSFLTNPS